MPKIYFTDYFEVPREELDEYGAFNISLISDLPLFVDPFLLFNSENPIYQELHESIITYLRFLRDRSLAGTLDPALVKAWFMFSEVRQTWLGFTESGNRGSGLGRQFAESLHRNLGTIFSDFGNERVTLGSHLEKLCLIRNGVGRDMISDFTTNLIKSFLLEYTQTFARQHLQPDQRRLVAVPRARFKFDTESWETGRFELPWNENDYVLLTPKDILTKDETWISRRDLIDRLESVADALPNEQLRAQVNNYLASRLSKDPKPGERRDAAARTIEQFPALIEHYIRYKEDRGEEAHEVSRMKVAESEELFIQKVTELVERLQEKTPFYSLAGNTYDEARARVEYLKDIIENQDGYRTFYSKGQLIKREKDVHILYRLTWFGTPSDVTREANDGRGPVDFKVSRGAPDKSLVEFKLASNSQLKRNLERQVDIYEKASGAKRSLKVILYFSAEELKRVTAILNELKLHDSSDIILIDARNDNKPSGSKA